MVERPSTKARPSRHGIRLEVDDVLYGVGELQRRTVPIARHVRKRNSRRGPVPRKLDLDPDGTQRCYVCKEDLSLFAFSADASRSSGIMSRCKKCNRKRAQVHAASPGGRSKHRRYQLLRTYNLTPESYTKMLKAQEGKCAICRRPSRTSPRGTLYVDHDHHNKRTRGLLCGTCNSALGLFKDNPSILYRAALYLVYGPNLIDLKGGEPA